ncbi:MAG TPA: HAMP domain-containing sensor histidine kinase [Vicinamibacterales bacterium]|nr:HAMP domain-containing sensor histidine kinase [Vicinamibacterales bacterium]
MAFSGRQKTIAFVLFGASLVAVALVLNVSWVVLNWRQGLLFVLGTIFFLVIITGVVLNTIFLVREVRRNEQHDTFINSMTHELKTPVASIRLYLETLQRRELDEAKRQEFYKVMLEDSDRLMRLIDQALRAARVPRQKLQHKSRVDVPALVRECVDLARNLYHLDESALSYAETAAGPVVVMGDPDELKTAVSNLIDNAVKYSNPPPRIRVEVTTIEAGRVAIRVHDHGVGISRAELTRIFRRFYRIPGAVALRVKGSGLGLFIVSSVARKHGGSVSAESPGPGQGSTFTLQLPLAPAV